MTESVNGYQFCAQLRLLLLSSHDVVTGLELQLSRLFKRDFFFFFKEASPAGATCVLCSVVTCACHLSRCHFMCW